MLGAMAALLVASGAAWDLGLHLETRAPPPTAPSPGVPDVEADPTLAVHEAGGPFEWAASYSPRFVEGGSTDGQLTSLHALEASQTYAEHRLWRFQLTEQASYGTSVVSLLGPTSTTTDTGSPAPPSNPEILPGASTVTTMNLGGSARGEMHFSPTSSASASAGFSVSGGLGSSRALIPLQHQPAARGEFDQALARTDSIAGTLSFTESRSGPSMQSSVGTAAASWHHSFTASATGDAVLGLDDSRTLTPGQPETSALLPRASLAAAMTLPDRGLPLSLSVHAMNSSAVDPLTIRTYQRFEGGASCDLRAPVPGLALSLQGLVARAYGVLAGDLAQGELRGEWAIGPRMRLVAGGRMAWLTAALAPPGMSGLQWTAYLSLELAASGTFQGHVLGPLR